MQRLRMQLGYYVKPRQTESVPEGFMLVRIELPDYGGRLALSNRHRWKISGEV